MRETTLGRQERGGIHDRGGPDSGFHFLHGFRGSFIGSGFHATGGIAATFRLAAGILTAGIAAIVLLAAALASEDAI